jgi:hypothetical protein
MAHLVVTMTKKVIGIGLYIHQEIAINQNHRVVALELVKALILP